MDWSQLNTPTMTVQVAACIMGVPQFVAEKRLMEMHGECGYDKAVKALGSRYPLDDLKKFGIRNVPFAEIGYGNDGRENAAWYAGR